MTGLRIPLSNGREATCFDGRTHPEHDGSGTRLTFWTLYPDELDRIELGQRVSKAMADGTLEQAIPLEQIIFLRRDGST